ncbi:chemotaxis protein CheW [Mesorhizobium sp. M0767]|uniref:chemotaxis protein CheW n=1 Tax=unclassified Mesorhizobium TaxID=325217 RepID=UPI003334C0DD
MLFLGFCIGSDRYVLDMEQVEEILPYIGVRRLPGAPNGVVGLINCRGLPVPMIDLSLLALGRPSALVLSTRIVLIRYPTKDGENHLLALVAERATDMLERDPSDFAPSGMEAGTPPYLGPVASDDRGLVQWVRAEALLSDDIRETLFRQVAMSS